MYSIRNLKALIALSEDRHFGRTAARLGLTQSALSRRILMLEREIGAHLVERTSRSVAMTASGERLVDRSRRAVQALDVAVAEARDEAIGLVGRIRIGYNRIALSSVLIPMVRSYREALPRVGIDLLFLPSHEQIESVANGALDVGFVVGPIETDNVEQFVVAEEPLVAVVPSNRRELCGSISLKSLAREPFVLGHRNVWRTYRPIVDRACVAAGFVPDVVQEADTTEAVLGLVSAGAGVTLYLRSHGEWPGAAYADLTDCKVTVQTVLIYRAGESLAHVNRFLKLTLGPHRSRKQKR